MDQAKKQIKTAYKDRVAKYGPIWAIIDERWNNQLHRPMHAVGYFLNPRYHYKALEARALAQWWEAFGSHCPQLQKFAIRILSQTCNATGCERNWSVFERIHTKKRNHLDKKRLNDLVYVQYNLWLRRNQLLNKRPDSNPIVLEDIDPTSDWVVDSNPGEFDSDEDLDLDLQTKALVEGNVQLNADPLVPAPSPLVAATSSSQPRQKRISRCSWR
eukprot:PITA_14717